MDVYEDSFIDRNEFHLENIVPYFEKPIERTRPKYEALMDLLPDRIQHLPKSNQIKYNKLIANIVL